MVKHVVFRHGHRGPTLGALKPFESPELTGFWNEEELEQLTQVGLQQGLELGKHLAKELKQASDPVKIQWYSSKVDRVVLTGHKFFEGVHQGGLIDEQEKERWLRDGPTKIDDNDTDYYFRTYMVHEPYVAAAKGLRSGSVFHAKCEEEKAALFDFLDNVEALNMKEMSPAQKANVTTYLEELLECEKHSDDDKKQLSMLVAPVREHISRVARWCWDQRFFRLQHSEELGQPLHDVIMGRDHDADIVFYSAHDYTIMSLLKRLGYPNYPSVTLGYCSYLIIDIESGSVTANLEPFRPDSFQVNLHHIISFPLQSGN